MIAGLSDDLATRKPPSFQIMGKETVRVFAAPIKGILRATGWCLAVDLIRAYRDIPLDSQPLRLTSP